MHSEIKRWMVSRAGSLAFLWVAFLARIAAAGEVHPIVDANEGFVVGASGGGKWWNSEDAAKVVNPTMEFRLFSLTRELGSTKAEKPKPAGDPLPGIWMISLANAPREAVLGIAAPWNPLPRVPRLADPAQPACVEAVRQYLQSRGIAKPAVKITKIVRVDLDGDGIDEVLISATNYFMRDLDEVPNGAPAGSYSCVLLRREVNGKVKTQLVAGDFFPKKQIFNAPMRHEIAAVLDLTGDGGMEVVLRSTYYEGGWTAIYRCTPAKVTKVLETGGGA